jgi:Spy/CpxP family protein refolding chaperone
MKKVILFAACLISISTIVNAQEVKAKSERESGRKVEQKMTPEQRAQKNVDNLNAEVLLTDDQKTKLNALALSKVTKVEAIRAKYNGQPENKEIAKTEIEVVRKEFRKNIKTILTPEQQEKLKAKHKEMKAAGKANSLEAND